MHEPRAVRCVASNTLPHEDSHLCGSSRTCSNVCKHQKATLGPQQAQDAVAGHGLVQHPRRAALQYFMTYGLGARAFLFPQCA